MTIGCNGLGRQVIRMGYKSKDLLKMGNDRLVMRVNWGLEELAQKKLDQVKYNNQSNFDPGLSS